MPFRICRWSSFGRPVRGFSGGSSGSSCCHCWSVKSPRLMALKWEFRPETSAVCRHGLGRVSKRLQPEQDHADVDHGEIVLATLLIAGGNAPGLLEAVDQPLDLVA